MQRFMMFDNEEGCYWSHSGKGGAMVFDSENDPQFSVYRDSVASGRFTIVPLS
jgi:hypothetical protein